MSCVLRRTPPPQGEEEHPGAQILGRFLLQSRRRLRRHVKQSVQKFLTNVFFCFVATWGNGREAPDACCATNEVAQLIVHKFET